jgi:hypothetical protein
MAVEGNLISQVWNVNILPPSDGSWFWFGRLTTSAVVHDAEPFDRLRIKSIIL